MNTYTALKAAVDRGKVKLIDCSLTNLFGVSYSTDELKNTSVNAIIGRDRHAVPLNALRYADGIVLEQPNVPYNVSVEFLKSYDRGYTNISSVPVDKHPYPLATIAHALPDIKAKVKDSREKVYERLSQIEKLSRPAVKSVDENTANGGGILVFEIEEKPLKQLSRKPLFETNFYTQLPSDIKALLEKPR
jgi:hypothetical protein